jgi:ABC-type Fe3+-siderophore transport system permease subunit
MRALTAKRNSGFTPGKGIAIIGLLLLLVGVAAVISINSGKMGLTPGEVFQVLLGNGTARQRVIVFDFRLPRIVLSVLVGIGMGASGCIMQSLLRNDMASPGTLGISSGSGLFVILAIAGFSLDGVPSALLLPFLSFAGGLTAAGLIFLLSHSRGRDISPTRLILTGVAVGSGYSAYTLLVTLKLDENQMEFAQRWMAGSLWGDDWRYLAVLAPWVLVLTGYALYKSRMLNAIRLGNQTAAGLGLAVRREFIGLSLAAVALSSGSVAVGGNFFFVGMISPHLARRLVGPNHKLLLPAASLTGALVVLLADTLTRTVSMGTDVPTGIVITLLSTPYFLYLLAKSD